MKIKIETPYITLGQFMKHANIVQSGGQAKDFIINNKIEVNGVITDKRGKKLYPKDFIKVSNTVYQIIG